MVDRAVTRPPIFGDGHAYLVNARNNFILFVKMAYSVENRLFVTDRTPGQVPMWQLVYQDFHGLVYWYTGNYNNHSGS